jgi:hypothetical protein
MITTFVWTKTKKAISPHEQCKNATVLFGGTSYPLILRASGDPERTSGCVALDSRMRGNERNLLELPLTPSRSRLLAAEAFEASVGGPPPSTFSFFLKDREDVDARNKCGHDGGEVVPSPRHGRIYSGHPRLACCNDAKTWMPATGAGMTGERPCRFNSSWPGLSRPSRLGRQCRARLGEMPGTRLRAARFGAPSKAGHDMVRGGALSVRHGCAVTPKPQKSQVKAPLKAWLSAWAASSAW